MSSGSPSALPSVDDNTATPSHYHLRRDGATLFVAVLAGEYGQLPPELYNTNYDPCRVNA